MKTNTCYVVGRLVSNGCNFTDCCKIYTHKGEEYFLLSRLNTWVFNDKPMYNNMVKEKQVQTFETLEQASANGKDFVFKVRMQGNKIRKYLKMINTNPVDTGSLITSR